MELLEDIQRQIDTLKTAGSLPAVIKMTESTWNGVADGILQSSSLPWSKRSLFDLAVMFSPEMKPGTARVYMEWE